MVKYSLCATAITTKKRIPLLVGDRIETMFRITHFITQILMLNMYYMIYGIFYILHEGDLSGFVSKQ